MNKAARRNARRTTAKRKTAKIRKIKPDPRICHLCEEPKTVVKGDGLELFNGPFAGMYECKPCALKLYGGNP